MPVQLIVDTSLYYRLIERLSLGVGQNIQMMHPSNQFHWSNLFEGYMSLPNKQSAMTAQFDQHNVLKTRPDKMFDQWTVDMFLLSRLFDSIDPMMKQNNQGQNFDNSSDQY